MGVAHCSANSNNKNFTLLYTGVVWLALGAGVVSLWLTAPLDDCGNEGGRGGEGVAGEVVKARHGGEMLEQVRVRRGSGGFA